ncbi:MAG: hypothetical protein M3N50_00740 [Pseudomonadota bacterium]|nr:hypothetical protein [Pseudomonadota bacterium]
MSKGSALSVLLLGFAATAVHADGNLGDMFSFSGFGTVGVTRTNTDAAEYVPGGQVYGATRRPDFKLASNLGLQETVTPTEWLSATVQGLAQQRFRDTVEPKIQWAFVKVKPLAGLSIRAGQLALPTFLISDSRSIGFVNNWIIAPNQVYAQATFDTYKGADVAYQYSMASSSVTLSALAGHTRSQLGAMATLYGHTLRGYNASWDGALGTVRLSHVQTQVDVFIAGRLLASQAYTFNSIGGTLDHDNVVLQGEFIERRVAGEGASNLNGWYVLGGYRAGNWLPYGIYARGRRPAAIALFPGFAAAIPLSELSDGTISVGLRADLLKSVDFKLQFDHVHDSISAIPFTNVKPGFGNSMNVISVAVDFVF